MRLKLTVLAAIALSDLAPATAQIVVDHEPSPYGGSASDLAFEDLGVTRWQQSADDIVISAPEAVVALNWWAWYNADNPPNDESIRVRLYANRDVGHLPGKLVYEQKLANPVRTATGRHIL